MIIWITGAGGLIGNYLARTAREFFPAAAIHPLTRAHLDLTDSSAVREMFLRDAPQIVVHCAAMSRNPDCQANPALARKLNVEVTAFLADLCAEIQFIFFSTDLVFDGQAGNYDESASVNPLSVYAETKVAAEQVVLANKNHTVVRTSLNGGTSPTGDRGFNEVMRRAWAASDLLSLFKDEFRSPIFAEITARATWELAGGRRTGIYHIAGSERLSRLDIGRMLAERWRELKPKIQATSLKEFRGPPRPPDTSLDCSKARKILNVELEGLSGWLSAHPGELF